MDGPDHRPGYTTHVRLQTTLWLSRDVTEEPDLGGVRERAPKNWSLRWSLDGVS